MTDEQRRQGGRGRASAAELGADGSLGCALAQGATLEGLRAAAGELAGRAAEGGLLRAGEDGPLRAAVLLGPGADEALDALATGRARPPRPRATPAPLAWLFPGQGAQRAGAGAWWCGRPAFAEAVDACARALDPALPRPLRDLLTEPDPRGDLGQTAFTQPVLVAFGVALAEQWRAWGVRPSWVLGHSLGELSAAWAAEACTRDEVLALTLARGRALSGLAPGAMAAACAAPERVAGLLRDLGGACWVAAANGSQDTVLAGPPAALEDALALLRLEGVEVRPLAVSYAAHGPAVAPGLRAIEAAARQVPWAAPRCGWISSLDGASVQAPPTPAHWRRQTLEPVRFAEALGTLRARGVEVLLELGPGASLSRLAARALPSARTLTSAPGDADPARHVLEVAARLWEAGHPVTWERLLADLS